MLARPQSFVSKCESGEQRVDGVEVQEFAQLYEKDLTFFVPQQVNSCSGPPGFTLSGLVPHTLWVVVGRVVHPGADRVGCHRLSRIRAQEGLEAIHLLDGRVEPEVVVRGRQDHRHPVMQGTEQVVGASREDGEGVNCLPLGSLPVLPQPGKSEGSPVVKANVERLLAPVLLPPLVEPVRQDQAPAFAKGRSKGGLGRGGLGLGIEPPMLGPQPARGSALFEGHLEWAAQGAARKLHMASATGGPPRMCFQSPALPNRAAHRVGPRRASSGATGCPGCRSR